ncbi:MAG: dihydrodipicolinate synthase family protein [Bacteroidetes bacterium]|nr:dihydrodipicolinate synthase family protein [Bacteroidota bacterium]
MKLNGIFPPLPCSFDNNENLALDKMCDNITKLSQYDLTGFLVLGSNGELVNLSDKEKQEVFEATREAIPADKIMLAGTGCQSTRETIHLTNAAAKSGADAVLVLNPSYYRGLMTKEALTGHYFAVADASPLPVIVYNMPANSGLDMNADTIVEISAHQNIIGMKDSGGNIVKMGDIRNRVKPEFQILAGSAGFLLPALSIGAIGGILALANIAPKQCIKIYKDYMAGDLQKARETQHKMIAVNAAITSKWGVPALKEAMDHIGLYGGVARKPILSIKQEIKKQLVEILSENNIRSLEK